MQTQLRLSIGSTCMTIPGGCSYRVNLTSLWSPLPPPHPGISLVCWPSEEPHRPHLDSFVTTKSKEDTHQNLFSLKVVSKSSPLKMRGAGCLSCSDFPKSQSQESFPHIARSFDGNNATATQHWVSSSHQYLPFMFLSVAAFSPVTAEGIFM